VVLLIETLSNRLAKEITLLYYLNLIRRDPSVNMKRFRLRFEEEHLVEQRKFLTTKWASNPAKHFVQILKEDRELNEWFNNWKKDILDFQDAVKESIIEEPERTSRYEEFTPHWYEEEFGTK
jgi:hypothetical protein